MTEEMSFQVLPENCQGFSIPDEGGKFSPPARNGEWKRSGEWFCASLWWHISVLNLMQAATGSQCREIKRGVTWALLGSQKTSRAAAFWIICKGLIVHDGSPARRELQ